MKAIGGGREQVITLTFSVAHPWRLRAELDSGVVLVTEERDLFECLITTRRRLERDGLLICCEGARPDVFPSGMARQMGGGRRAYRLSPTHGGLSGDLVDIFAPTDCTAVCTVDEQTASVERLLGE